MKILKRAMVIFIGLIFSWLIIAQESMEPTAEQINQLNQMLSDPSGLDPKALEALGQMGNTNNEDINSQLGLQPGDVVTAINGVSLSDPAQAVSLMLSLKDATSFEVTYTRNGESKTIKISTPK